MSIPVSSASIIDRRRVLLGLGAGALSVGAIGVDGLWADPAGAAGGPRRDAAVLGTWIDALYDAQRDARALPPAAARLYALGMLAGYEAVVDSMPRRESFGGRLNGLEPSGLRRGRGLHWAIAANAAIGTVAVAGSADRDQSIQQRLAAHRQALHDELAVGVASVRVRASVRHGEAIGSWIAAWAATDNYAETRSLAYTPPVGPGLWRSTPPNFGAAIEPHWHLVRPFTLRVRRDASGRAIDPARPAPPIPFDPTPGSPFHQQAMVVYEVSKSVTDDQRAIALHWRDNPDGVTGLPSGHWLKIAHGVTEDLDMGLPRAAHVLALVAISVADGFTSCWIEKYRSNVLRPISYINDHIDPDWRSIVNTPQFPEYTSGHSVGSGAAAEALAQLVGERPFVDRSVEGLVVEGTTLGPRRFPSFTAAADEAAVSRLYGGIHYPMGIDAGVPQGHDVTRRVLRSLGHRVR